jgi:four helix bundle protein
MPPEPLRARTFRFACRIVWLYTKLAKDQAVPRHLAYQVLKAGTSIGANLEEGAGSPTRRDYRSKVSIALKEARETEFWLRLLLATALGPATDMRPIHQEAGELIAILTVTRRNLKDEDDESDG